MEIFIIFSIFIKTKNNYLLIFFILLSSAVYIIKSYNLNNILVFDSNHFRSGAFAYNSKGDMVIEYSYHNYRLFYGLKKNGKGFFLNNNKETVFKELTFSSDKENRRYESRSLFI